MERTFKAEDGREIVLHIIIHQFLQVGKVMAYGPSAAPFWSYIAALVHFVGSAIHCILYRQQGLSSRVLLQCHNDLAACFLTGQCAGTCFTQSNPSATEGCRRHQLLPSRCWLNSSLHPDPIHTRSQLFGYSAAVCILMVVQFHCILSKEGLSFGVVLQLRQHVRDVKLMLLSSACSVIVNY